MGVGPGIEVGSTKILPGVHRVFSLSKRVLEGTYPGGVQDGHLQAYLDEYVFRFNRRTANARGLLFLRLLEHAVTTTPTPYSSLIIQRRPDPRPRPATGIRLNLTGSLPGRCSRPSSKGNATRWCSLICRNGCYGGRSRN